MLLFIVSEEEARAVLRAVREAPIPIGNYVRPSRRDQRAMLGLLAEGRLPSSGVVIDPTLWDVHKELGAEAASNAREVILDPLSLELSTPVGLERSNARNLPWAGRHPHVPAELRGEVGSRFINQVLDFAVDKPFTAFLSPSHYIDSAQSAWVSVDMELAKRMRAELDARGLVASPLYYQLILHAELLRDPAFRQKLIQHLLDVEIDALWLRVHPFGTTVSGPLAIRRYLEACRDLLALGVPLVGDRTGTLGIALTAFGALGGVEGGITLGERFDVGALTRRREGKPFAPPPRVYIREMGAFISREQARALFDHRGMKSAFGCQQDGCCRRGAADMIADPKRHFLLSRGQELDSLSTVPEPLRAGRYLEQFLRPASDLALRATRALSALDSQRKRLDAWREVFGSIHRADADSAIPFSRVPNGSRVNGRLGSEYGIGGEN